MFSFSGLEPPPFNPQRMVGYIKKRQKVYEGQ